MREDGSFFDVFFHQSDLFSQVANGDSVSFHLKRDRQGGLKAVQVQRAKIAEVV